MKKVSTEEQFKIFKGYWEGLENEFFKLETLQRYAIDVESEAYKNYFKGNHSTFEKNIRESFQSQKKDVAEKLNKGIKIIRSRVVVFPLSKYVRFQLDFYKLAKEILNISILVVKEDQFSEHTKIKDFILFDSKKLIVNNFNKNDEFISAEVTEDEFEIKPYLEIKEEVIARSLELDEFLSKNDIRTKI